ncbi:putative reverse transcriptase domain-containing protein [Tanacetum coccineum]
MMGLLLVVFRSRTFPNVSSDHDASTVLQSLPQTVAGTDISKITRKQSKTSKHGHENGRVHKSQKQSQGKVNPHSAAFFPEAVLISKMVGHLESTPEFSVLLLMRGTATPATTPVDAENWIAHIEKIFEVLGCADEFKARLASYKVEGRYSPITFPGFIGKKAGPLEEQTKHFKWALCDWILDGIVNTEFTDVAQVANAARNIEILRERSVRGTRTKPPLLQANTLETHPARCHRVTGACFTCGSTRHMARDCPKNGGNDGEGNGNDNQPAAKGRGAYGCILDFVDEIEEFHTIKEHPRIVYPLILNINYFRYFLDILRNYYPMDDEPMWAADHVVALTPDSAITIPETANKFTIKGTDISKITRKQSKMGKHGHENQKSTKRSQRFKAKARKVKPQSNPQNHVENEEAQGIDDFALQSLSKQAQEQSHGLPHLWKGSQLWKDSHGLILAYLFDKLELAADKLNLSFCLAEASFNAYLSLSMFDCAYCLHFSSVFKVYALDLNFFEFALC